MWKRFGTLALVLALLPHACVQNHAVGKGEACFLATDCEPGFVCVPLEHGGSVCSDDLSGVAGESPPEAGPADANADVPEGGNDAPNDGPPPADGPIDVTPDNTPSDSGGTG